MYGSDGIIIRRKTKKKKKEKRKLLGCTDRKSSFAPQQHNKAISLHELIGVVGSAADFKMEEGKSERTPLLQSKRKKERESQEQRSSAQCVFGALFIDRSDSR